MALEQLGLFGRSEFSSPKKKEKKIKVSSSTSVQKRATEKKSIPSPTGLKRGRKSYKEVFTEIDLIDVPDDETLQKKLYYPIGEVATWFRVTTSQIRFWENEFDILQPRKTRKGDRLFRAEDVKNLKLIYYLLRNKKLSIEGAKEYLKTNQHKASANHQLIESLTKFKSFLLELKVNLDT